MSEELVRPSLGEAATYLLADRPHRIDFEVVIASGSRRRRRAAHRRRAGVGLAVVGLVALLIAPLPQLHLGGNGAPAHATSRGARPGWRVTLHRGAAYRLVWPTFLASGGGELFVSDAGGVRPTRRLGGVSEVDAQSGRFVRRITALQGHFVPGLPVGVTATHLWLVDGRDALSEVAIATGAFLRTVHAEYHFDAPTGFVVEDGSLFVANSGSNTVVKINAATGVLERRWSGARDGFDDPDSMAIDGKDLFVVNGGPNADPSVTELNVGTGDLVRLMRGPRFELDAPISIAIAKGFVWVVNYYEGDSLTEISARTGAFVENLSGPSLKAGIPFSVSAGAGAIWLAAGRLEMLDPTSGRVEHVFSAKGDGLADSFSVVDSSGHVWTTNPQRDSLTELCRCS